MSRNISLALAAVAVLAGADAPADITLKIASFNVHGPAFTSDQVAPTVAAIRASGADVVGLQEGSGNAPAVAAALGWNYRQFASNAGEEAKDSDTAILTRLPITQTLDGGVRLEVAPGREVYVFDAHLPAWPYQPYDLRDGKITTAGHAVAAAEGARGKQADALVAQVTPYLDAKRAVFVTGDFNEPSHLDWTPAAAKAGLHPFAVAYPASSKLAKAGLADSYREIHPDEVKTPGDTWTSEPAPDEVFDRIDFVYFAGPGVRPTATAVVGENPAHVNVAVPGFASDHRLIVSTFAVPDAAAAPLRTGVNLLSNGGAEANVGTADGLNRRLTDWEADADTPATAQLYGPDGYASAPPTSGKAHFYGGTGLSGVEVHAIHQTVDLADLADVIAAGHATYALSGDFGGYRDQPDAATLTASFRDAAGKELATTPLGGVTPADRQNRTALLPRHATGPVPAGARSVRFTLTFAKGPNGTASDGSADNLSFVINAAP